MILSSRVLQKNLSSKEFRTIVPEWASAYLELDNRIAARKAAGKCGTCGLMKGTYETLRSNLIANPALAERLRKYFKVKFIDVVLRNPDGSTEFKRVAELKS